MLTLQICQGNRLEKTDILLWLAKISVVLGGRMITRGSGTVNTDYC